MRIRNEKTGFVFQTKTMLQIAYLETMPTGYLIFQKHKFKTGRILIKEVQPLHLLSMTDAESFKCGVFQEIIHQPENKRKHQTYY